MYLESLPFEVEGEASQIFINIFLAGWYSLVDAIVIIADRTSRDLRTLLTSEQSSSGTCS
ncbi:hypothetical protein K439DRAFT_156174 [Ramaria rubella]|nr:hypothetical protein K439DRAFT_156174 [Ramaria rubella]